MTYAAMPLRAMHLRFRHYAAAAAVTLRFFAIDMLSPLSLFRAAAFHAFSLIWRQPRYATLIIRR